MSRATGRRNDSTRNGPIVRRIEHRGRSSSSLLLGCACRAIPARVATPACVAPGSSRRESFVRLGAADRQTAPLVDVPPSPEVPVVGVTIAYGPG